MKKKTTKDNYIIRTKKRILKIPILGIDMRTIACV